MSEPEPDPGEPTSAEPTERVRRVLIVNYTLIALAVVSIFLVVLDWTVPLTTGERDAIVWIDRAAIAAFGLSFAARMVLSRDTPGRLAVRWPELIGLLPLFEPVVTGIRFYPIVQVVVVGARLSSGLDRQLGEHALRRLADRYSHMVVEEITDRVLIRGAHIAEDVARKGRYAASVGEALDATRDDVHGSVDQALDANPNLRMVAHLPGVSRIVHGTVDATLDAAIAQLTSEEMDRVVHEVIHRTFEDFRVEVARKEWKQRGVRPGEAVRGGGRAGDV